MNKVVRIILTIFVAVTAVTVSYGETKKNQKMETKQIEAKELYDAFKNGNEEAYKGHCRISGIATYVGPDVYGLPSVELSETNTASGRVLCVLPFTDYLKLRKVSKKDRVIMEGNVMGFADEYDIVVVKRCEIVEVNGKKK